MEHKWKTVLGDGGFYVLAAACLLAVGVGGYFLLLDRDAKPAEAELPPQTEAAAPAPEIREPEEPAVVETIQPAPVEEPAPMPELEIDDTPVVAQAPQLVVSPLKGEVLTAFSVDALVYNATLDDWRTHDGVDIAAKAGTTVLSASAGTVLQVDADAMMGTTVVIDHGDGYQTTYANLQAQPTVETGDSVSAGQIIGAVGTTAAAEAAQGPHLHFSVTRDGDAVDPQEYLNR
ncbi:peptidoglycan DD-metalloendopeptidase family protein [uncultured Oscillibacter sp.]|uniref:peptidoglycan DD-metalloendopeptidase family protein n=1 Tax=uncultured Oscillibacter sp. TaxID=876091 RepID=UPI0025D2579B|nr:peptidoglycan DD-metalloendopeptidase family protein [uncultured Oscillibacter sp.]